MDDDLDGLPAWRPGTQVRYWPNTHRGPGEHGLTDGLPFVVDGVPVVHIAGRDRHSPIPLSRVEWLGHPSTESWWAARRQDRLGTGERS